MDTVILKGDKINIFSDNFALPSNYTGFMAKIHAIKEAGTSTYRNMKLDKEKNQW